MFTAIACNIIKAADMKQDAIKAAEFVLKGKKKALDMAQKEYDAASDAVYKAKLAAYNARKGVVQDYIDNVLMKMKAPDWYDPHRVQNLRKILASFNNKDTYAKRLEILAAIRELQVIFTKYPITRRVGNIIREWTGNKNVTISEDGSTLKVGNTVIMQIKYQLPQNDFMLAQICREYKYKYLLKTYMSEAHYAGTPIGLINEFWESRCLALPIDPSFVIGDAPLKNEPKCTISGLKDAINTFLDDCDKYHVKDIGTELFKCDESRFSDIVAWVKKHDPKITDVTMTDVDWASNLIALNPRLFTVKELMNNYGRFSQLKIKNCIDSFHNSQEHLDFMINRTTEELQKCAPKTVKDIKFDADLMAITWHDPYDKDMVFDPDTCEMQHPSQEVHKLDVKNIKFSNICMYAYRNIPGMKKPENDD